MEEYWGGPKYADREEAGRVLAEKLEPYSKDHPVVLAIPNGGVPVGPTCFEEPALSNPSHHCEKTPDPR